MNGKKTLIGALLVGLSAALQNAEQTGAIPNGSMGATQSILTGLGYFFTIFGLGHKLQKLTDRLP